MPVVLLSIFVSLLPARYRGYWLGDGNLDVRHGAIISAVLQFVVSCGALWALYPAFFRARLAQASAVAAATHPGDKIVEAFTIFAYGQFALLEYLLRPLTLLLLYVAVEGAVRIFSAVATDVILPTLPLAIIARVQDYATVRYREAQMGCRIADVIELGVEGKYDLKIESCRPKEWNGLVTIRYNDEMYQLESEQTGHAPRPFVYLLRRKPGHKVVCGLHDYDPEETLRWPGWADMHESPRR